MTQTEHQKAAKEFAEFWKDKGDEKQESQRFWIDLLQNVLGVSNPAKYIEFEKRVQLSHTSYIDAYIADTKVLIEQKGRKIDIHKAYEQSDGAVLTPFEQAKRYADELPNSIRPRWIVVCNFGEFLVYDLENPQGEPEQIFLKDLPKEFYRLQFLVDQKNENIRREEELSLKAGELVGKLYDALIKEYYPSEAAGEFPAGENSRHLSAFQLRSLNILCVRIVFCLYAEDAGLFDSKTAFEDYIKSFAIENLRDGIIKLFKALDTKERDKYDLKLNPFPYVNGGLFRDEQIEIPNFTQEIVDVIVNHCAPFNWSDISPTIFGAVFESTLNPETRRKGGMHYTSIQNIHKVIDPLFMDDLNAEFDSICATKIAKQKTEKLHDFQAKLGSLKFLDPACGSGNFLTETYISLRRLENKVISILNKGETVLGFDEFIKVHINQFYGIEINDFAVTVAKTALWIAESQMATETEAIISQTIDFLPLKTGANIVEGNALRMDWATLTEEKQSGYLFVDKLNLYEEADFDGESEVRSLEIKPNSLYGKHMEELNARVRKVEKKKPSKEKAEPIVYDYIIGNPPFSGARIMRKESDQKKDIADTFAGVKGAGNLDYVCCWYKIASEYMKGKNTKTALVSTNSICQGEHVSILWKLIFGMGIKIDFAYRTFKWYSESDEMAHVHCVIVGFSESQSKEMQKQVQHDKFIFDENGNKQTVRNINGYLLDLPNVFIESRKKPICNVTEMVFGSMANDGRNLLIEADEYDEFVKNDPTSQKYIRQFLGSEEFINCKKRYCLWLVNASPAELRKMPLVAQRVGAVKKLRESSTREATRKLADVPHLFGEIRQPKEGHYLLIPRVSSEKRYYIPIGFINSDVIASDATLLIPNASLYDFGIMTSNVHNAWMRVVSGKLESRYRYSASLVYNNFIWCNPSDEQKAKIEQTAQAILDARAQYPDSSLADLYDETFMPPELRKAHRENDKAVMQAYGFKSGINESEIVAELFRLYEKLTK